MAKTKISTVMLTQNDFDAMDYIRANNPGLRTRSAALLFASEMQVRRDEGAKKERNDVTTQDNLLQRHVIAKIKPTCVDYKERGHDDGAEQFKKWTFVNRVQVKENLAKIKHHHGFDAEVEAVRLAIRVQAELDGFVPDTPW